MFELNSADGLRVEDFWDEFGAPGLPDKHKRLNSFLGHFTSRDLGNHIQISSSKWMIEKFLKNRISCQTSAYHYDWISTENIIIEEISLTEDTYQARKGLNKDENHLIIQRKSSAGRWQKSMNEWISTDISPIIPWFHKGPLAHYTVRLWTEKLPLLFTEQKFLKVVGEYVHRSRWVQIICE